MRVDKRLGVAARHVYMAADLVVGTLVSVTLALAVQVAGMLRRVIRTRRGR
jgi:hypothetical protein